MQVTAQRTTVYTTDFKSYNEALELFDKEKYGAATKAFEKTMHEIQDPNSEFYVNAEYYTALCALNLFHRDAEYLFRQFIANHPESPRVKSAYFNLGQYNFRKKKWKKVIHWLSYVEPYDLSEKDLNEYYFRLGYSYFQLGKLESAASFLKEIIDVENAYYSPGNYYYGHIAYEEGNYQTALKTFEKLENDPKFSIITPYYIAQIYFYQKKYEQLTEYAIPMLKNPKTKRKGELARLVGEAYYHQKKYAEAIPYLEQFNQQGAKRTIQDKYELGYAYYQTKQYKKANDLFKACSFEGDSLAQLANYQMADCYLKLEDKRTALTAFQKAYSIDKDQTITEDALFNFAQLSYELDFDPYSKAIEAFILYLERFPDAVRKEQAYDYLINIYLNTNNYRSAIASLEMTKKLDPRLAKAYQQLVFNYAIEQFQNGQYPKAVESFQKSLSNPQDQKLETMAYYWMAESYYRSQNYPLSVDAYSEFLFKPQAILLPEFRYANYGIGYAYFKSKDYINAAKWFRKFVGYKQNQDSVAVNDAYIRIGDCYFIEKQYYLSLEYYEKAIEYGLRDNDYTLYQFSLANGVMRKTDKKMELLEKLVQDYKVSPYVGPAKYELAYAYRIKGDKSKALSYFNQVVSEFPNSSYRKKALEQIGSMYFNQGQNTKALETFKQVVEENPNYRDASPALKQIQEVYKDMGEIAAYESYVNTLDFLDISEVTLDTLAYEAAELQYLSGRTEKTIPAFRQYLTRFEKPLFALQANFYLGETEFKEQQYDSAVLHYQYVLDQPISKYTEPAVINSAWINYTKANYENALDNYILMEKVAQYPINKQKAKFGKMRCYYELENYDSTITAVNEVLEIKKIDGLLKIEALFKRARSYELTEQYERAIQQYDSVIRNTESEYMAKSMYYKANIFFQDSLFDTTEVVVFNLINNAGGYDDWLAKGMILLSDVYRAKADNYQARGTLEALLENYDGDQEILEEARAKLDAIIKEETPEEDTQEEEVEIDLGDDATYQDLFEEEEEEEEIIIELEPKKDHE